MSCSLHDSFELERKAIPTATICTTGFLNAGRRQAEMLGIPGLALVGIPFPFATLDPQQARARGAEAMPAIIAALTGEAAP